MRHWTLLFAIVPFLAFAEDPPPPSTGNEMPKAPPKRLPSQDESRAEFDRFLAEAKNPKRDCGKLISPWTRLMFALARPTLDDVKRDMESYLWLARCAEKQRYYVLEGDL